MTWEYYTTQSKMTQKSQLKHVCGPLHMSVHYTASEKPPHLANSGCQCTIILTLMSRWDLQIKFTKITQPTPIFTENGSMEHSSIWLIVCDNTLATSII